MANKSLFKSLVGKLLPQADAINEELAPAYRFSAKQALAQYAATGCMNATFYASAEQQLAKVLELSRQVEPEFIARMALYARAEGFMKDLPALLCGILAVRGPGLLAEVFDRVIDEGRMLRNFVQIIRSGVVGRKSLGTLPKRLVLSWIESRDEAALFRASVGNDPSLADVVKMVHPKPSSPQREALYGYLIGRDVQQASLPEIIRQYEAFKAGESKLVPDVPFQMLSSLPLAGADWIEIARHASWQMTRMNLNTFGRHGVFASSEMSRLIAHRLRDEEAIAKARAFPYQLMVAYAHADATVPPIVREALQDAMEIALRNVPSIDGTVYVCPDVSGSMRSPITGARKGATTAVRCVDVAALVAAAILRKNPLAKVIPFETHWVHLPLNPRDTVMSNAQKLASVGGGGTNCSAPLQLLNQQRACGELVVFISDNESWVDANLGRGGTAMMKEWNRFKERNPKAKLVCIDLQPYGTTQAKEREDILNIGGFSDHVFDVISRFADGTLRADHWVGIIEAIRI